MNPTPLPVRGRASLFATASHAPRSGAKPFMFFLSSALCLWASLVFSPQTTRAASFPGNARVEIPDDTGGLSWKTNVGAQTLTVQCWFKLSIPSGVSLSDNMTILVNRRTGTTANPHAYHVFYDKAAKSVQFSTRGSSFWQGVLISRPHLDRWYHLAVVRNGNSLAAYVDGTVVTNTSVSIGDSRSTEGISIGGWGNGKYLYGEVQEVTVYQSALTDAMIRYRMFDPDQSAYENLVGYYRLGYTTDPALHYANSAPGKPSATEGGKAGSGTILFEETDWKGEQSLFDSLINGGKNAIVPLSGAFTWEQSVFSRAVPGVPFDLSIAYSPSTQGDVLGQGWNHSFNSKVESVPGAKTWNLVTWQGGVEVWDGATDLGPFQTRHGEYRGGLGRTSNADIEWTNAASVTYRFLGLDATNILASGRLSEVRDLNGNSLRVQWDKGEGRITNVVDSVGGNYRFSYNTQNLLTNISYGDWQVVFYYTNMTVYGQPQNFLASKALTNTSGLYTNVDTTLRFYYNTNGVLERIVDARRNTNVIVYYDEYGRKTNVVNALGQATRTDYGFPDRRQITTTDAEGFKWIETYDRKGRTIARKNPLGHATRFTYDEHGNRASVTDPVGNTTLFAYDEHANVIAQTNALGEVTRTTYDLSFNKPVTVTDPLGWATTNVYDSKGNLLLKRDALGTLASYTYTANGLVRSETDANGNITRFGYNADGFLVATTNAGGFTRHSLLNDVGWTEALTNELGEVTSYAYDVNGNTVRTLDPLGRVYAGTYDENGNLVTQTDPKGQQARHRYDALNQKTLQVERNGGTNWFGYTPRGAQAAFTNALGRATLYQYDAAGRETSAVDALGNSVATVYDPNGNAIAIIDAQGQRWTKVFDRLNRAVAVTDPSGNSSRTVFDRAGRVRETIDPQGFSTTYVYDGRGRMIRRTDALGSLWQYDYDGAGNLTNVTDALGGHYAMTYGSRNERILERNQDGREWHYTYDALLRLQTQQQTNGTSQTIEYDSGNRVLSVTFSTGRVNSFLYDDNDNPIVLSRSGSGPATISQMAYDSMDRVQQYTDAFNKTVRYEYDVVGRLAQLTYPDGKTLTYGYDPLDRLTNQVFQFSPQQAFATSYAYDDTSRLVRRTYPNGLVQTNTFDTSSRIIGLSHSAVTPQPSTLNIDLGYTYGRSGNTIQSTARGTFQWPVPGTREERARYTAAAQLIDRQINVNSQLSTLTYNYDWNGNMTNAVGNGQTWSLTYDEDNRTTSIHWDSGVTAKDIINRYDIFGRRIARTADGVLTGFVLDITGGMERTLCDLDSTRSVTAWYVHGPDLSFKVTPGGGLTCYHADAQGNIIALSDGQAKTVAEYAYTPYGRILSSTNSPSFAQSPQPYLFAGSQGVMEELPGLYFMRARYYSADAGVFLSTDPVRNVGPTWLPIAFAYGECNPLRFNDPNGEVINFIVAAFTSVGGAIVGFAVDVTTQLIENHGDFGDINWGRAGIAAGIGFVQGAIAGLTMGASIPAQIAIGMAVGGATSLLQTGLNNLTEGKEFIGSWQEALFDVGTGAALGAIPGGGKPKPKVHLKIPKPPGILPALRRAKTAFEPPKIKKPSLHRSLSSPALEWVQEKPAANMLRRSLLSGLRSGTKDFLWGVGSGLFGERLAEWMGVEE